MKALGEMDRVQQVTYLSMFLQWFKALKIAKKKVILLLWKCWYNNLLISFKLSYQFPLLEAENENCITLIQNQSIFSVSFHYFFFLCHTVVKTQDELAILSGLKNEDKYSFHEKLQNLKEIVGKSKL